MNVKEIFESNDAKLKSDYSVDVRHFAKERIYKDGGTPEDRAIKLICDIYFFAPDKVSVKQIDWLVRYATKFRIVATGGNQIAKGIAKAIANLSAQ